MLGASFPVWSLNWWKQYEKDSKRPLFEHFLGLLAITYISCLQIQDSIGKAFDLRFLQNKGSSFSVFFSFLEFSVIYWIRYNFPILCYLLFNVLESQQAKDFLIHLPNRSYWHWDSINNLLHISCFHFKSFLDLFHYLLYLTCH